MKNTLIGVLSVSEIMSASNPTREIFTTEVSVKINLIKTTRETIWYGSLFIPNNKDVRNLGFWKNYVLHLELNNGLIGFVDIHEWCDSKNGKIVIARFTGTTEKKYTTLVQRILQDIRS